MGEFFTALEPKHIDFIKKQKLFFIATAPREGEGYPNLSPKGYDALHVLANNRLAFIDLPGSGNQTASHLGQGAAVTIMFCGFESQAVILRCYGHGRSHPPESDACAELARAIDSPIPGDYTRQIFEIQIEKVQTSCGYGVPRYEYQGDRPTLLDYCDRLVAKGEFESKRAESSKLQANV